MSISAGIGARYSRPVYIQTGQFYNLAEMLKVSDISKELRKKRLTCSYEDEGHRLAELASKRKSVRLSAFGDVGV